MVYCLKDLFVSSHTRRPPSKFRSNHLLFLRHLCRKAKNPSPSTTKHHHGPIKTTGSSIEPSHPNDYYAPSPCAFYFSVNAYSPASPSTSLSASTDASFHRTLIAIFYSCVFTLLILLDHYQLFSRDRRCWVPLCIQQYYWHGRRWCGIVHFLPKDAMVAAVSAPPTARMQPRTTTKINLHESSSPPTSQDPPSHDHDFIIVF